MQPGGRKLAVIVAVGVALFACRATQVGEGIGDSCAYEEAAKEWRILGREVERRTAICPLARDKKNPLRFTPAAGEVVDIQALIWETDRDALDVVLRRTKALANDLKTNVGDEALRHLSARADSTPVTDVDARFVLFVQALRLRKRIAFSNPLLKGIGTILFVGREAMPPDEYNWGVHMCDQFFGFHATQKLMTRGDGLYVLENPFSEVPRARNLLEGRKIKSRSPYWNGRPLALRAPHMAHSGGFLCPDVSYDGKEILFCWTPGKPELRVWNEETCWHVMKCRADGSELEMVTWGDKNDLFPCWLPNGRVVFCSERRGGYGRCHFRECPNFTLFTMFPDGTDITCISPHETNEFEPSVDNDGMIVYTRWDYTDRGHCQAHHPWITYPDGRDPREFNGNSRMSQVIGPHYIQSLRAIPGSRKYVGTACGHHTLIRGSLVTIDPSVPDDDRMSQIKRVTPDQLFPESEWVDHGTRSSGAYATAWPLSEKYYICVYDGDANGQYGTIDCRRRNYAITLVDVFGNKVVVYRNNLISCFDPMPLQARKMPPVIPHKTLVGRPANSDGSRPVPIADLPKTSEVGLINVYNSRYPFPEGVKIKELRVWQILPKTEPLVGHPRLGACDHTPSRRCLGTVPVEEDGSALFEMPVTVPFYMQALDEKGCAVQTMRSATYTQPGERLTCNGCHENRSKQAQAAAARSPLAYRRPPSRIKPEVDGGKPWNYPNMVQPVFDRKCVSCHSPSNKKFDHAKMPNLTRGDRDANPFHFHTSFIDLVEKKLIQFYTNNYSGPRWYERRVQKDSFTFHHSEPGKIGARGSKLYETLRKGHNGVELTDEEMRRLVLFMDASGAYISHDFQAEAQCFGGVVEPKLQ